MKMSKALFDRIAGAIDTVMEKHSLKAVTEHRNNIAYSNSQFISFCWSMLRASSFDITELYNSGLNDSHIETALKRILSDFA